VAGARAARAHGDDMALTRTSTGELHGFSAVWTHRGCTVDAVADGTIDCPWHGSRFDATTGAVRAGNVYSS
jgi:nitrite reductase/ring-hydroxylating ferredoxin subunit